MPCKRPLDNQPHKERRIYGRRLGRPLNAARREVLGTLLPKLEIQEDLLAEDGALDPYSLLNTHHSQLIFEIGFGNGEHLAGLMQQNPKCNYIGAEPFINGMAMFLKTIKDKPHDNLRVFMDDALKIAKSLQNDCVDKIYVLNPDPWPKTRHHKRRIISQANLDEFARILKPGGTLVMSTDVEDLAEWMVTQAMIHPAFSWQARCAKDWQSPPENWIHTLYEKKGAKGAGAMTYLLFDKKELDF